MRHESEGSQSVIDRDHEDTPLGKLCPVVASLVPRPLCETSSMYPKHDRVFLNVTLTWRPHV